MTQRMYFGTDGVRGRVGSEVINPEFALRLGYAAGRVFTADDTEVGRSRPMVMIGKDTRISGYMLESALQAGLSAAGVDVLLAGPMPTPAVAYLTRALRLSAGIVISASHNPYHDNGIKFFSASGKKLADETELAIEALLDQPIKCVDSEHLGRAQRIKDAAGRYIEFCKSSFPSDLSLRGLKIVVDAAHGAAYGIAHHVFEELGAEVVAVGANPDGFNINHQVGTEHLEYLVDQVLTHQADLGVALDGDADRLRMVDQQGRIYNGDELLYAMVKARLGAGGVAGVVGTLMTNFALEKRLKELGVGFARAGVGDRYVLELLEQKEWLLGGESSGHLICLDKHSTGDGIIAALQVLAAMQRLNKSLVDLLSDLVLFPQTLINVGWDKGDAWKTHQPLLAAQQAVEQELGNTGRVLIRASGTEPKLRVMVEAMDPILAKNSAEALVKALS